MSETFVNKTKLTCPKGSVFTFFLRKDGIVDSITTQSGREVTPKKERHVNHFMIKFDLSPAGEQNPHCNSHVYENSPQPLIG
jgi:hypothetical protein